MTDNKITESFAKRLLKNVDFKNYCISKNLLKLELMSTLKIIIAKRGSDYKISLNDANNYYRQLNTKQKQTLIAKAINNNLTVSNLTKDEQSLEIYTTASTINDILLAIMYLQNFIKNLCNCSEIA